MKYALFPLFLLIWEGAARFYKWADYFVPMPTRIFSQLMFDWPLLWLDFKATSLLCFLALVCALIFAFICAMLSHLYAWAKAFFAPITLTLQITPLSALAPLLLIYTKPPFATLLLSMIISFYPLYNGFLRGFSFERTDHTHLFSLLKANKWQKFKWLDFPQALPFAFSGLEVASGLSVVGTVVGEFMSGAGNGLAIRLLESQYRLNIPRLYACLFLIILLGLALRLCLRGFKSVLPSVHAAFSPQ